MQRMRLDSDTTVEPAKSQSPNKVSCNIPELTTNGLLNHGVNHFRAHQTSVSWIS